MGTEIVKSAFALYPPFADRVLKALDQANRETAGKFARFERWGLFETYRSPARQAALYAQGRTTPGPIVTHKRTGGYHSDGLAADIVWFDADNRPHWDGPEALWARLGHAARSQGLVWGGDWKFRDKPHLQCTLVQRAVWLLPARLYLKSRGYQ